MAPRAKQQLMLEAYRAKQRRGEVGKGKQQQQLKRPSPLTLALPRILVRESVRAHEQRRMDVLLVCYRALGGMLRPTNLIAKRVYEFIEPNIAYGVDYRIELTMEGVYIKKGKKEYYLKAHLVGLLGSIYDTARRLLSKPGPYIIKLPIRRGDFEKVSISFLREVYIPLLEEFNR